MTIEEQGELKKILVALNGLINQLLPEDDVMRLALDPKRQASAARVVGTTALARDMIDRALELCELMPHPGGRRIMNYPNGRINNGRPSGKSKIDRWMREHLPTSPTPKPEFVARAVKAGYQRSNVYFAINRLVADGSLKQTESKGAGQGRELYT
jgi:hypothetical protein